MKFLIVNADDFELACHPGHYDPEASYVYHRKRERDLATLCDARLGVLIQQLELRLISYQELPAALTELSSTSQPCAN